MRFPDQETPGRPTSRPFGIPVTGADRLEQMTSPGGLSLSRAAGLLARRVPGPSQVPVGFCKGHVGTLKCGCEA